MKFYRPKQLRAFMRPVNRRLRYRRYVIMFIICIAFTLLLNALHRAYYYKVDSGDFAMLNLESIPYYLIERNYMQNTPLSAQNLDDIWSAKETFKNAKDSVNANKVVVKEGRSRRDLNKSMYLIYEFTRFNKQTKYCQLFDDLKFNDGDNGEATSQIFLDQCPVRNCIFTCKRDLLDKADAVLFNEYDLRQALVSNNLNEIPLGAPRNDRQVWVLWNTNEAQLTAIEYERYKFNWTLSYRQDSEVSDCANGCIYGTKQYIQIKEVNAVESHQKLVESEFNRRENRLTFIIDDDCSNEFPIKLATSIDFNVSFKGRCKNSKPDTVSNLYRNQLGKISLPCEYGSLCERESLLNTKFLLIYQSINCTDYLRNLFWRCLDFGIIPVVIYPEKVYYEKLAPHNSYIHAEDFAFDGAKLGEHLKQISEDFSLYLNYFKWKFYLNTVSDQFNSEKRLMCELCHKLNTEQSSIHYESVLKWFNSDCKK